MAAYVETMISLASRSAQQLDHVDAIMVSHRSVQLCSSQPRAAQRADASADPCCSQRKIGLPARVQLRVHSFYDYMYRVHGVSTPAEEVSFLDDLTPNLRQQIMVHKCRNIIANCPLFTTTPPMFRLGAYDGWWG